MPRDKWLKNQNLRNLFNAIKALSQCEVLSSILDIHKDANFKLTIKPLSHVGVVCKKGRAHDPGNFLYSVLFCLLLKFVDGQHPLWHFANRFPSTTGSDSGVHTTGGMEKAGDIIEMVLG